MWGVLHDQERDIVHQIIFQDAHDRRMLQVGNDTCLLKKTPLIVVCQSHLEHFDRCLRVKIYMLAKVHISEATLSK
jgi:hypothetical protein